MANLSFDATSVAPADDFSPLPPGDYTAVITESEMKSTKRGDGSFLALTFEITEGPSKGRKVWTNLNLRNPNPKAVEIAQRELSAICHATGQLRVNDSQELHYKPMVIRVDIEERDGYSPKNVVKAYKAATGHGGQGNAPSAVPSAAAASSASPSSSAPPWANRAA